MKVCTWPDCGRDTNCVTGDVCGPYCRENSVINKGKNLSDSAITVGNMRVDTFLVLRALNRQRAERWHGSDSVPWTGADWSNAMCGEAGEVANAVKKMRRLETGVASNNARQPLTRPEAQAMIAKEIGDTIIYLDLLAAHYEIGLAEAIAHAFNTVSQREGFPEMLELL